VRGTDDLRRYGAYVVVEVGGEVVVAGTDVVVDDVDVVVFAPNPDPAGAPMAGGGSGEGAGARVVVEAPGAPTVVCVSAVEPVGVTPELDEPAAAVTGRGPDVSAEFPADVVVVRELRAGAVPPDAATSPTTTPVAASAVAIGTVGRPRTTDHSARGCTMRQA
jgi:hypothetical protein